MVFPEWLTQWQNTWKKDLDLESLRKNRDYWQHEYSELLNKLHEERSRRYVAEEKVAKLLGKLNYHRKINKYLRRTGASRPQ